MARGARLNKVIELLERGQPVFCAAVVQNGDWDGLAQLALSDFDMAIVETEHQGFDLPLLRHSLQHLLHRGRIAAKGSVQPDVVPFVRIPPYARERNQWVIKQTLDAGAYGLVLPHLDSVDAALAAMRAARYPQALGSPDLEPAGERGWWPWGAAHYWGISPDAYYDAADLWPLDPDGELLLMGIIENAQGLRALPEIAKQARGIGAIWVGPGDLSVSLGYRGDLEHPEVEAAVQRALRVCKEQRVPVAAVAGRTNDAVRRLEQGFDIVVLAPSQTAELRRARESVGAATT
jgi:4-hydroxy-2-oxoheptanedioate aldolase